ncbi:hypothetical protein AMAG_13517 [Allomyces macrogynus ATCC 38327]|uniref:Uncharacterized protein n=1 Tax=Allomyces macrogynus (strain ATCC 38327) TaxID=578462 RepID=A0A0L0T2Q2_ALLM3|nr:hypothetical protein AMAG_13517 [Allomyces macrogynus ATCC 38327]|eukprot:KNE68879.1 hypothetical protein AMAG_13517 [Allomyces macrogynus ATCC 38327]
MASLVVPAHAESASCAGVLPSLPAALPRTLSSQHLSGVTRTTGHNPLLLSPAASPASIPLPPTPHSAVPTAVTTASKHATAVATPLPPTPISTLSAPARAPAPATPAAAAAPIRLTVGDVVLTASRVRPGVVDYARVESLAAGDRGAVLWRRRTLYLRVHGGNVHFCPGPTSAHWEPIDRIVRVVASPGASPAPSGMPIVAASPFRASTPIARRRAAMGSSSSSSSSTNSPSTATTPTSARAHPYARPAPVTSKASSSASPTKPAAALAISVPSSTVPTPSPTPSPHRSAPAAMTIPSSPRVMPVVKPRQRRGSAPIPPPLTLALAVPATPPPAAVPSIHDMVPTTPPPLELPASAFDPHVHVARPWCLRRVDEERPTVEDAMLLLGLAMSGER